MIRAKCDGSDLVAQSVRWVGGDCSESRGTVKMLRTLFTFPTIFALWPNLHLTLSRRIFCLTWKKKPAIKRDDEAPVECTLSPYRKYLHISHVLIVSEANPTTFRMLEFGGTITWANVLQSTSVILKV